MREVEFALEHSNVAEAFHVLEEGNRTRCGKNLRPGQYSTWIQDMDQFGVDDKNACAGCVPRVPLTWGTIDRSLARFL